MVTFEMSAKELSLVCFRRTKVIRQNRARHGITVCDMDRCRHLGHRSSSERDIRKSTLLGMENITFDVIERVVTMAHGENEVAKVRTGQD